MPDSDHLSLVEAHRHFATATNGEVWRLLEQPDRTPANDEQMLAAAFASLYHWLHAGTTVHHQRSLWLISRVYGVLGNGAGARDYAQRCLALTEAESHTLADFDVAYGYEGMARAHALAGNHAEAYRYRALAQSAGEAIADDEDRAIFAGDLAAGPWAGLV
jgi:hypothetical protein